jgi:hypothetical protein
MTLAVLTLRTDERQIHFEKETVVNYRRLTIAIRYFALLAILGIAIQNSAVAKTFDNQNGPELPGICSTIQVEEGHKLAFHVYARGVQIYKWNGTSWVFEAPVASLFAEPEFFGEVGTHYVGPRWESKSGSKVRAARVLGTGCRPDPTAIEWLLLARVESSGPGIFEKVTFIQRTNTTGGIAPLTPGTTVGEVAEVPYTAEYYFYRAH